MSGREKGCRKELLALLFFLGIILVFGLVFWLGFWYGYFDEKGWSLWLAR